MAVDIPDAAMARTLVRSVANAYPDHGRCLDTRAYWFRDRDGRRQIWSVPDHAGDDAALPPPRSLLSRLKVLFQP